MRQAAVAEQFQVVQRDRNDLVVVGGRREDRLVVRLQVVEQLFLLFLGVKLLAFPQERFAVERDRVFLLLQVAGDALLLGDEVLALLDAGLRAAPAAP